jgi:hypothetical protein
MKHLDNPDNSDGLDHVYILSLYLMDRPYRIAERSSIGSLDSHQYEEVVGQRKSAWSGYVRILCRRWRDSRKLISPLRSMKVGFLSLSIGSRLF